MSTDFEKDASRTRNKTKKLSHSIMFINFSALSQLEFTKCESYLKPTTKIRLRILEKFIDCPVHMKRPFFLIVSEVNRVNYTIRKRCVAVVLWVAWVGAMWVDSCWIPPPHNNLTELLLLPRDLTHTTVLKHPFLSLICVECTCFLILIQIDRQAE